LRLIRAQYNLQKFNNLLEKQRENTREIKIGDITRILDIEDLLFDYISFVLPEKIGHLKVLLPKPIRSGLVKEHTLNVHKVLLPLDVSRAYEEYRNIRHIEEKIDKLFPSRSNISLNDAIDEIFRLFNQNFMIDGFSEKTLSIDGRLHLFKDILVSHDSFELHTSRATTIDYITLFEKQALQTNEYFESLSKLTPLPNAAPASIASTESSGLPTFASLWGAIQSDRGEPPYEQADVNVVQTADNHEFRELENRSDRFSSSNRSYELSEIDSLIIDNKPDAETTLTPDELYIRRQFMAGELAFYGRTIPNAFNEYMEKRGNKQQRTRQQTQGLLAPKVEKNITIFQLLADISDESDSGIKAKVFGEPLFNTIKLQQEVFAAKVDEIFEYIYYNTEINKKEIQKILEEKKVLGKRPRGGSQTLKQKKHNKKQTRKNNKRSTRKHQKNHKKRSGNTKKH
jgi:hypothetical protein